MSDKQWIRALEKYSNTEHSRRHGGGFLGGEHQLAAALEGQAQRSPKRFLQLALQLPDSLPSSYFDAILRGIAATVQTPSATLSKAPSLEDLDALIKRLHGLPDYPCGAPILWLIHKWKDPIWPDSIVEIVSWYALHDPNPSEEVWSKRTSGGQFIYNGDIYMAGINSTRGAAAGTIAHLIFERPGSHLAFLEAIHALATDRTLAVRACAIEPLTALLNHDEEKAITWFLEGMTDPRLFSIHTFERFLGYAAYRSYPAVRGLLMRMLESDDPKVVKAAARRVCLVSLDDVSAQEDSVRVRQGSESMRSAATEVYSANIGHEVVGPRCLSLLLPMFHDSSEKVRAKAAKGFERITKLGTHDQQILLEGFLESSPDPLALNSIVASLANSPVQLPDLVCSVAEACIEKFCCEPGVRPGEGFSVSRNLAKIVIRLYTQTEDPEIQRRCLDLVDIMEKNYFYGIDAEMELAKR
jgi:hypothetical protein